MAWLKSVTEMCLKTNLSTLPHMLKNVMAWLFIAYKQMREGALNQCIFKQKRKKAKKACHNAYLSKNLFRLKLFIFPVIGLR